MIHLYLFGGNSDCCRIARLPKGVDTEYARLLEEDLRCTKRPAVDGLRALIPEAEELEAKVKRLEACLKLYDVPVWVWEDPPAGVAVLTNQGLV
jgi:hypothetical protein